MMLADSPDGRAVLHFGEAAAFDAWLDEHHGSSDGIWIQMAKRSSGIESLTWKAAVPVALCHGWIDGQSKRIDDVWFLQRFTPRRPRSSWSQVNVAHVERLVAEGLMRPWGMASVEQAKADGRWDAAYQPSSSREIPAELQEALDAAPGTAEIFAGLDSRNRYAIVHSVQTAKRLETRQRRALQHVEMLARGDRLY